MITINHSKLKAIIDDYKVYFPTHIGYEIYKWQAVKKFQDTWNIDAEDFKAMYSEATSLHDNLLTGPHHFARAMMEGMIGYDKDAARAMFVKLFDEELPLTERIAFFTSEANKFRDKYFPGKMHYQDINTISLYLWSRFPEKYYMYKYSEIKEMTQAVDSSYIVKKGASAEGLLQATEFCNIVRDELEKDADIKPMLNAALTSDCYSDEQLHVTVGDVVFFTSRFYDEQQKEEDVKEREDAKYWMYAPGEQASQWEDCLRDGIMVCGWDEIGDYSAYESPEAVRDQMKETYDPNRPYKNDGLTVWNFFDTIKPGDVVYARRGRKVILGRGIVTGGYAFDPKRNQYKSVRKVKWERIGEWALDRNTDIKTLTEITQYEDYRKRLEILTSGGVMPEENCHYFWLTANPKVWSMSEWPVGEEQDYTLYNGNGNKRRIFHNFTDAKAGDRVICYEANPVKQIVGLAIVSKQNDGNKICFEKTEALANPIDFEIIKADENLKNMEFLANPNGSFFKLTKDEYGTIMDIIRDNNETPDDEKKEVYTRKEFLEEVFMSSEKLTELESLLRDKLNVVLQGAPGVGKTFSAKRLAFEMMGEKDESRVRVVQFHQNYSYEDFILGYKPSGQGFELKRGVFYKFCIQAANDPQHHYYFIIDEINRGNLSKIFGELLMLIEKDYRGTPITLAYTDEKFSVPNNIYIIGMMNTADRSLAMIDYALRRRFSFVDLEPGFDSEGFKKYQQDLNNPHFDKLIAKVKELNEEIGKDPNLGSGFEIGHSYFCGQKSDEDEGKKDARMKRVIAHDIIPTLREYWFDEREKVKTWNTELNKIFDD